MNIRSFSLRPLQTESPLIGIQILGSIERSSNIIAVSYELLGLTAELGLPAPAEKPSRRSSLWEDTCFELFLGINKSDSYWEINLSPAGHWNVYHFDAYRQGMKEETAITSLPICIERKPGMFLLSLRLDLGKIVPADQALEIACSAVIKPLSGPMTYWALVHPGQQADFHRRDGFIIGL